MDIEAEVIKIVNNLTLSKSKTKWEVIGNLSDVYIKIGEKIRYVSVTNDMKEGRSTPTNILPYEKIRADVLELIKILANSQP